MVVLFLLVGCAHSRLNTSPSHDRSSAHGIVRYAITTDINTLNPILATAASEVRVEGAIFSGLVKFNDRHQLIPDAATVVPNVNNGGISADRRTITYHLRHGVTWQDGQPFSAADVVFTFAKLMDPNVNAAGAAYYAHIEKISTPDDYTVVVRLKAPWAPAIERFFSGGSIIPRHLLDHSRDFNHDPFGTHPIGTGPMRLQHWEHASHIALVPYEHYFGGAPKIQRLDILILPDANTRVTMLRAKELDAVQITNPNQVASLRGLDGYKISLVRNTVLRMVTFNLTRAPFSDVRVRQALALALDRRRLREVTYAGAALPAESLIPPFSWAYDDNNGSPPFDPRRADQLLTSAGWIKGPDGMRHAGNRNLSFTLVCFAGSVVSTTLATLIQQSWRSVGADVSILPQPLNVLVSPTGLFMTGKFDTAVDSIALRHDPDRTNILSSKSIGSHGSNNAAYASAKSDRLADQAASVYAESARKPLYAELQRLWNRDLPYLPIAWEDRIYGVSTQLHGFKPEPIESDFWNVQEWQI